MEDFKSIEDCLELPTSTIHPWTYGEVIYYALFISMLHESSFYCSADQVRSLSSRMHDAEGYFQFFSVDFSEEMTMQHGSVMVNQAYFVNFALRKIRSLYKKNKILTGQNNDGFNFQICN